MSTHIFQGSDGHYYLASNCLLSELNYDITQTHMLSCGHEGHKDAPFAARDAAALSSTLVETGLVQQSNLRLGCLQAECSTEAMRVAFKTKASLVGENGLFLFAYHGPAVSTDSTPSLVSSNYRADSAGTHVTATTILGWLEELGDKKPKRILFFLDCQFASEIAQLLTGPVPVTDVEKMCVFCANTPTTLSLLTATLDHSMFTYFAMWAFRECTLTPELRAQRTIHISAISDGMKECCAALGRLCMSETHSADPIPVVMSQTVKPLSPFQRFERDGSGQDMVDGEGGEDMRDGAAVGRFDFVEKHYKTGRKKMNLCNLGHRLLGYLKCADSPLQVLNKHQFLSRPEMIATLHRLVLYRLALTQQSEKRNSTADPNTLVMLYVLAAGVIDHVAGTDVVQATVEQFHSSCQAYCLALNRNNISSSKINELAKKIKQENK